MLLTDNEKAFGIIHWSKLWSLIKEKMHPAYVTKTVQRNTKYTL